MDPLDPEYVLYLGAIEQHFPPPGEGGEEGEEDEDQEEEEGEEDEDQEEEEDEDDEEEDGSDGEEEDDGDEVEVIEYIPAGTSASVPGTGITSQGGGGISQRSDTLKVLENGKGTELGSCGGKVGSQENGGGGGEIEGLFCPICMEAWTNVGLHQVCCLPCGHLYGLSCIKRWLRQCQRSGKCPQCKRKCTLKDVRLLYATQICVADDELPKKIQTLEAKCASLEKKNADCWKTEAALREEVLQLRERTRFLEGLVANQQRSPPCEFAGSQRYQSQAFHGNNLGSEFGKGDYPSKFTLQKKFQVDDARYFDVDSSAQIIVVVRRLKGLTDILTKISLIAPHERENIVLPSNTKAVRDLCISPHSRLVLLASMGKKLSILSTESNNTVQCYDLPASAWSCSWDINSPHHVYTGLQNGMLLEFDMRQTRGPMDPLTGLTYNPIHSANSLSPDSSLPSGTRTLLSGSKIGLCEWNFGGIEERPKLIPESDNQGVCISLACSGNGDVVASFRPEVQMPAELVIGSPPCLTPSMSSVGCGVQGSHIIYSRGGRRTYQKLVSTRVSDQGFARSAIINKENRSPLFASGDAATCQLVLQDLSSSMVVQCLELQGLPIRDVRDIRSSSMFGCLSQNTLQLFTSS